MDEKTERDRVESIRKATREIYTLRGKDCPNLAHMVAGREFRRIGTSPRSHDINAALCAMENALHVPMGEN